MFLELEIHVSHKSQQLPNVDFFLNGIGGVYLVPLVLVRLVLLVGLKHTKGSVFGKKMYFFWREILYYLGIV
jgi:hypothetical protein